MKITYVMQNDLQTSHMGVMRALRMLMRGNKRIGNKWRFVHPTEAALNCAEAELERGEKIYKKYISKQEEKK